MELTEEREKSLSEIQPKSRHFKISRKDTMLNDLKNSTVQGIISFVLSLVSFVSLLLSVYLSYRAGGRAGYFIGVMPIGALLMAAASVVLGILGFKNRKKIRHYMEKRGIILSVLVILLLAALYIKGLILYLH